MTGQAYSGEQLISLHQFEGDGVWREVGRESSESCTDPCLLPTPGRMLLRELGDLSPVDVTRQVRRQANLIQVFELDQYARALGARTASRSISASEPV